MIKELLLLNGSPRKSGTSYSFIRSLAILAEKKGVLVHKVHIYDYFDGKESMESLWNLIEGSECIGLVAPLYVDTLPYPVLWFLEGLQEADKRNILKGKGFFTLCQYGFPDSTRSEPLLNSCKFFAQDSGMKWLGGLGYGGGPLINGAPLEEKGKIGMKISLTFESILDHVLNSKMIPRQLQDNFGMKIPRILMRPMGFLLNHMAYKEARKLGVELKSKPYLYE